MEWYMIMAHIFHYDDITNFWKDNFEDLLFEKPFYYKNYKDGILYDYPISWESIEKFPQDIKDKVKEEIKNIERQKISRGRGTSKNVLRNWWVHFKVFSLKSIRKNYGVFH